MPVGRPGTGHRQQASLQPQEVLSPHHVKHQTSRNDWNKMPTLSAPNKQWHPLWAHCGTITVRGDIKMPFKNSGPSPPLLSGVQTTLFFSRTKAIGHTTLTHFDAQCWEKYAFVFLLLRTSCHLRDYTAIQDQQGACAVGWRLTALQTSYTHSWWM